MPRYVHAARPSGLLLTLTLALVACGGADSQPQAQLPTSASTAAPTGAATATDAPTSAVTEAAAPTSAATEAAAPSMATSGITQGKTAEGYWYLGQPEAPVTLTNYSDFL